MQEEDFGLTLGCYKGPGFYLNLPFVGSSSLRDGIGTLVDMCIVPSLYVLAHYGFPFVTGAEVLEAINRTSLRIGEYEKFKLADLDPSISAMDASNQNREDVIRMKDDKDKEINEQGNGTFNILLTF
jgi:phospholipid-binding lipoprotein MlaA